MNKFIHILLLFPCLSFAQSFAPAPGQPGSTAIAADSSIISYWASDVIVNRGPMDIMNPGLGNATYGVESEAIGPADGISVLSLGDGGDVTITFSYPISNGVGPDFAIFENGFLDHYMELGFVEVSSDGTNFYRFENTCEIPTDTQIDNFTTSNCGYVNNLAGKYRVNFGTPFDLEEMTGIPLLDVNAVTHVRIIDAIGSIDPNYGTYDSQGTIINDPYPTPWESSGFDLDGVAVINSSYNSLMENSTKLSVYPNPVGDELRLRIDGEGVYEIYNELGILVLQSSFNEQITIRMNSLPSAVYLCKVITPAGMVQERIVKL